MVNALKTGSSTRCRQIAEGDLDGLAELLARGFPRRDRGYWACGLRRHAARPAPPGLPRFGYLLEAAGRPVGVLLLICTERAGAVRCNVSSWYVEPEYRSFASLLVSVAVKHPGVTYLNISPAPHTWPIIEAHGFAPYCEGQFTAFPALAPPRRGVSVAPLATGERAALPEADLLAAHEAYGCVSLVVSAPDGNHPFVFVPYGRWGGRVPCARLIYCRDVADFVRFAGPLGRHLLRRGIPWVVLDANGPVKGLAGFYQPGLGRKYFKGPHRPRLGDLADTELALFGP